MKKAALFGLLSAAALPPLFFFPVLLICVPALLRLIADAPTRRRAFWLGYVFGFVHQLVGIYWITEAILIEAANYWWLVPIAVPLLAAIFAVLTAVPCLVAWHARTPARRVLLLAGAWVLTDLARQFIATGFPWNLWGSSLELPGLAGNVLIQPGALVGIHGMTLGVMLIAGSMALSWRGRTAGAVAFALWICFGVWRLHQPEPVAPGVTVVLAQGDVPETQKQDRGTAMTVFNRYLTLSAEGLSHARPGPRVLVWPESASPFLLGEDPAAREAIAQVAGPDTLALIGSVRFDGSTPFNSMFALWPGAVVAETYDKWHLVPFGEYQPSWLPFIRMLPGSFGFGRGPRTLRIGAFPPFEPLICYEAVFGGQIVDRTHRPSWLVNITNDAWYGDSSGPRQHLAAARMRAVEEGLPLMRAANTGVSAGYDAKGRELGRLDLDRSGAIALQLPGALPPTLFATMGLFVPLLLALFCLASGAIGAGATPVSHTLNTDKRAKRQAS